MKDTQIQTGIRQNRTVAFQVDAVRDQFPIFQQQMYGKRLIFLDSAATTQKPQPVIDTLTRFYEESNANIHRGAYFLSQRATDDYECARSKMRRFINAGHDREIIFVRGATEGINLAAFCMSATWFKPGDEIIISTLEHHANIVPWQQVCQRTGAQLKVIPMDDSGNLILDAFEKLLTPKTRLVAVSHVSNAIGTVNPVEEIIRIAHTIEVPVLVDGAQAVPHMPVDVQALDADFYVFSGHKMFGPTGVGVLYGKARYLSQFPPWQTGGDMIRSVTFEKTEFQDIPYRFEAGTPHIAGAIALGVAADFLDSMTRLSAMEYEEELLAYAEGRLQETEGITVIGMPERRLGSISFNLDGIHPHDIGTILDLEGIAIRTGHHCAQPLMHRLGVPATARASLAFYNTRNDIDALVDGLKTVRKVIL